MSEICTLSLRTLPFALVLGLACCTKSNGVDGKESSEAAVLEEQQTEEPQSLFWLRSLKAGTTRGKIAEHPNFERFVRIGYRTQSSTEEIVAKDGGSILAIFRGSRYEASDLDSLRAIDADGDRKIPDVSRVSPK